MRITHSRGEHLIVLSEMEAAILVDASALLVLASHSADGAALPPAMARVLAQLFEGLRQPASVPSASKAVNDPSCR